MKWCNYIDKWCSDIDAIDMEEICCDGNCDICCDCIEK